MSEQKTSRRQQILETLALQLEQSPGQTITTAQLAKAVGVSEAALYRHFASKAKMYDALIEFIEDSVFTLVNRILDEEKSAIKRCEKTLTMILAFAQKNPGLTRLLMGDILVGETERLRKRIDKFFERLETQLKQILREGEASNELARSNLVSAQASLLVSVVQGRIAQFVRSEFRSQPLEYWEQQWPMLMAALSHN
ncbi:MAG: nucleoid occlusion factor SlmA [Thioalkalispiraceae bacterium]|jgi:TetR/AcrR family transcriptional regulator